MLISGSQINTTKVISLHPEISILDFRFWIAIIVHRQFVNFSSCAIRCKQSHCRSSALSYMKVAAFGTRQIVGWVERGNIGCLSGQPVGFRQHLRVNQPE